MVGKSQTRDILVLTSPGPFNFIYGVHFVIIFLYIAASLKHFNKFKKTIRLSKVFSRRVK